MDNVNIDELSENTSENSWVLIGNRITQQVSNDETVQPEKLQKVNCAILHIHNNI